MFSALWCHLPNAVKFDYNDFSGFAELVEWWGLGSIERIGYTAPIPDYTALVHCTLSCNFIQGRNQKFVLGV